ncbi:MAG TPA: C45 family peptidase [Actinomycetota bacterium]|nr:C45 family peptidase [Actinomycetota bacterium]
MGTLRVVRATGDAAARGQHIGRELRDLINESIDFYHRYLARRGVSSQQLQDLLTPYLVASESRFPSLMTLLKAMAIGATVPVLELFAVNAFEELEPMLEAPEGDLLFLQRKEGYLEPPRTEPRPPADRCSSFTVVGPSTTILAHNEHWLAGDRGNVAVVIEEPDDRPVSIASPTIVCCLPAVGVNGHGGAQAIGSLTASDDRVGAPRVLVSRHALEAIDRQDALARAGHPARAGGYGHVYAFATGEAFIVETTGEQIAVVDGPGPHTNHYLDPGLAALGPEPAPGSVARLERLRRLLDERTPTTVPEAMDILRDHDSTPQAICLHPDPEEGEEASAVMFSMVADLGEGRMWVAPGNPCETEYEEVDLSGVL